MTMKTETWILQRELRLTPFAMAQMERMEKGDSEASLVHQVRMDPMVPTETQDSLVRKENKENLVRQEVQVQWALQEQMVPPEQTDRT
jgi:hypothetical protein